MFMISFVVVLLGAISLNRLPVDLMPDIQQPTITVRMNYPGVGPLEMEELIARPLEQALAYTLRAPIGRGIWPMVELALGQPPADRPGLLRDLVANAKLGDHPGCKMKRT